MCQEDARIEALKAKGEAAADVGSSRSHLFACPAGACLGNKSKALLCTFAPPAKDLNDHRHQDEPSRLALRTKLGLLHIHFVLRCGLAATHSHVEGCSVAGCV